MDNMCREYETIGDAHDANLGWFGEAIGGN